MVDPISSRIAPAGAGIAGETGRAAAAPAAAPSAGGRPATADPATVETGGIARALSQSAPVDEAKVAALKEAVQAASYALRPEAVADAMIRSLAG